MKPTGKYIRWLWHESCELPFLAL